MAGFCEHGGVNHYIINLKLLDSVFNIIGNIIIVWEVSLWTPDFIPTRLLADAKC